MSLGFDNSEAGNVLTVYGLVVAIASWLSGVMAEIFSPRRDDIRVYYLDDLPCWIFSLWSRTTKLCHDDDYVWYSWFSLSNVYL